MRTIEELKLELDTALRLQRDADDQRAKNRQASWKAVTDSRHNWEWSVKPSTSLRGWGIGDKNEVSGLRINCRVLPEIVGKWMQDNNCVSLPNDRDSFWQGMFYYRTDENILTHEGGGTHVLTSVPKLCTDEEWAELCEGKIPNKFRAKWIGGQ